ncbi:hypothetical protein MNBD_GAMMA15-1943 [hydrothermal vent metagenome]|uniref:Uncharacterized protein n=1 Tax=hydrothermal vent metagenome TaxID=652676 RepID=A0A3B0Y391_9ZZZZ
MKLCIETTESCDREELRTLLIDAADQLLGTGSTLLEAKLPWDGHPVLFADADGRPVLISFEPEHSQSALLNGLQASEQLSNALPWVNQVYEALGNQHLPVRLIVISRHYPPGTQTILSNCPQLQLHRYRTLNINGETGIWLEQSGDLPETAAMTATPHQDVSSIPEKPSLAETHAPEPQKTSENEMPPLSEEESTFFQQL